MKVALLSAALLTSQFTIPVSDRMPKLNVEALCKARSAGDKAMQLPEAQSVKDCVRDETDAKQKLSTLWGATSGPVRNRCEGDAVALGTQSYLDLLTCIQMAEDIKSSAPATASSGVRKKLNAK